eukprot:11588879-Ditylum_brightwellii.AAC.1
MQEDFNQDMEETKQRWAIRNAIKYNRYLSKPNTTAASTKEHQQQHQDHNATIRIQSIFCGYSTQQQLQMQKISAISIQAVAHGFIAFQQHKRATTIQALFQGCHSQKLLCLKCNAHPNPVTQ